MNNIFHRFRKLIRDVLSLVGASTKVKRETGKGIIPQLMEIARLWRNPNRLSPSEYYELKVYDDQKFDEKAKRNFLGWRSHLVSGLQPSSWHALANDKLIYYGLMAAMGFHLPRIYAIYHSGGRYFGEVPVFNNAASLSAFLRGNCHFPFYGKPVHGLYGQGNVLCTGYNSKNDTLQMSDGTDVNVDDFVAGIWDRSDSGYLFQQVLAPSIEMTQLWGNRLSTVRVVVALSEAGPRVVLAEWKIPTGTNVIDNFHDGITGNLIASVNTSTGCIQRVLLPDGTDSNDNKLTHPDTGALLMSTQIPDWPAVATLAMKAALVFPKLRLQGWDIACTTEGLIPLEVNLVTGRTAFNHQQFMQQGLFNEDVRSAWKASKE